MNSLARLLNTTSYRALIAFAPPNEGKQEEKTPAELEAEKADKLKKERERINVTTNEVVEKKEEEKVDDKEEEELIEAKEEQIEKSEKTEEELEIEKKEAQTQKEKDRIQRRIDKEVAKRKDLENRIKELETKLAAKDDEVLTEEDVEKRAEEKAANKVIEREFIAACNRLADAANKIDKDFKKKIDAIAEDIGPIPGQMIGILDDLDNGGAVLSYLANHVDDAETIYALSPAKMAVELTKLSTKIINEKKPVHKDISKVPDPGESLGGGQNRTNSIVLSDKDPMEDWIRKRNEQVARRNESKRQGMR
jgi:hypothetical protein